MTTCILKGISVSFPYEPYQIQKDYMEKVLECLQNDQNAVLESPTGTGKTLSLLCSSLAWLTLKKAQVQAQVQCGMFDEANDYMQSLKEDLVKKSGAAPKEGKAFFRWPQIIYASRTHSQLSQAMQEMRKTAYSHMKASVIGSRDQLCIHPEVMNEKANKNQLCKLKIQTKSCHFYNRVEKKKTEPLMVESSIVDIEDLVQMGKKQYFCPYYMSHELKQGVDILFMPYNYLLDPRIRSNLKIQLKDNVVILDEAHNIEKMCEEATSLQLKTTDIALCIEEVTEVMKALSEDSNTFTDGDAPKDFCADELCLLKEIFLNLEKSLDEIQLKEGNDGTTFDGSYIFEILSKAGITDENYNLIVALCEKITGFLSGSANSSPFKKKGDGLQLLQDFLNIAFMNLSPQFKEKAKECYKVHITLEDKENQKKFQNTWLSKGMAKSNQSKCRVLNYWCFSPGFGMSLLMACGVKCVILTSGTLAPLPPLISELGVNIGVRLENPHVIGANQICVKLLSKGPDGEPLNCSYGNRDNPKFISSVGSCILNLIRLIPDGVLIFFPSYPILNKCQQQWQEQGLWSNIYAIKPIFVEPRGKEAFNSAMNDYYSKINDPAHKGAIFMGVCRGKVSEGLDFADANGRAVLIVGLPYPPLKDPRIVLKKRYLDFCNKNNRDYLRGDDWYSLEAVRAINQAIGRVIRHQHDYGAIILLDNRFTNFKIKSQLSMWLRDRLEIVTNFGTIIRDIKQFFRAAESTLPQAKSIQPENQMAVPAEFSQVNKYNLNKTESSPYSSCSSAASCSSASSCSTAKLEDASKRNASCDLENKSKRKRIVIITEIKQEKEEDKDDKTDATFMMMVRDTLNQVEYKIFLNALLEYRRNGNFDELISQLDRIFAQKYSTRFLLAGLSNYIKNKHKDLYGLYYNKMR